MQPKPQDNEITAQIDKLAGHYILCGAGRTGLHIVERFCELQTPFVAVEQSARVAQNVQARVRARGGQMLYLIGDATEDETLEQAGIGRATGLISALNDDKENLFVILTARSLNPNLRIISRVTDERLNRGKLEKAGADKVISTDIIGGLRMASEMIRPEVVEFLDQMVQAYEKKKALRFTELPLTEIKTPALRELIEANKATGSELYINDIGRYTGLLVVAIKTRNELKPADGHPYDDLYKIRKRYRFTPRGNEKLQNDDILVVIGTQETLEEVCNA